MTTQCFKIKHGTDYDRAVKEHLIKRPLWLNVINKVGELLGEKITEIGAKTDELRINVNQLKKEENKKLFNKNGVLKNNTRQAKEILNRYKHILSEEGLSNFQELGLINFTYGVMRLQGEKLESYKTSENDIYYKADFDLVERSNGLVDPITEIEYEEKYLEELKKSKD